MQNDRINRFDIAIECLLYALLAFMPLALGAVQAWSQQVVIGLSALMAACFLAKLVSDRRTPVTFTWIYLPLIVFCLIPAFQLIRLPVSVVETISPNTAAIRQNLLGILPDAERYLNSMTLSFYPWITASQLRLVVAIATLFVVVLNVFRTPQQIKRLLTAITVIGGAIAVIALFQVMTQADKIYWIIPIKSKLAEAGPFVNHSHYGQFINLSIGAALGLLFVRLHEAFTGRRFGVSVAIDFFESDTGKRIWLLVAMVVVSAASVFISLTRGGIVSMLIAAGFTTLLVTWRQSVRGRGWIMVLMALGAFICVLYIGFDAVYDRLATLRDIQSSQGDRVQILKDIALAWTKFPLFGTGLGTHEVVYPMFNRSTIAALAAHAENEYAQAAEELGLAGVLSLLVFGTIVWFHFAKCTRSAKSPIRSAAYGLGFGLLAILIHSLSDFGQHLPANASLSAVFCALLIALSHMDKTPVSRPNAARPFREKFILFAAGALAVIGGWNLLTGNQARIAESHWNKALAIESDLIDNDWQGEHYVYIDLIKSALAASNTQRGNVHYRHWLNVYRWRSMVRVIDPETNLPILPPQGLKILGQLIDEFYGAISLCPTFGPSYCVVGQLKQLHRDLSADVQATGVDADDDTGGNLIRKGFALAPCDPIVCLVAGLLDVSEVLASSAGGPDAADPNAVPFVADSPLLQAAENKLNRAVQLDGRLFRDVVDVYVTKIGRPDLAISLARDKVWHLSYVADTLTKSDQHGKLAEDVRAQIMVLLEEICLQPDPSAGALASLARIYVRQDNTLQAIEYYRKALVLDYGQVSWRMQLSRLLAREKEYDDAIHEARICLRLKPRYAPAIKLIQDLSIRPTDN